MRFVALLLSLPLLALGCGQERPLPLPGQADGGGPALVDQGILVRDGWVPDALVQPPTGVAKKLDVLFVIDNSGSMAEEQQALTRAFPKLIADLRDHRLGADGSGLPCTALDRRGCKLPDLHIGVVSTDVGAGSYQLPTCERKDGDDGRLLSTPRLAGCVGPQQAHIRYDAKLGQSNVPSGAVDHALRVSDAFSCIAHLGTTGCGFESPLESARRALDPALARNPGFLRNDARLLLVFISDEDDCSARDPQLFDPAQQSLSDPLGPLTSFRCFEFGVTCDVNDRDVMGARKNCRPTSNSRYLHEVNTYVSFFRGLKPHADMVQVAAVVGPLGPVVVGRDGPMPVLRPSCQSATGSATPPVRLGALVKAFKGTMSSICDGDYGPAMEAMASQVHAR